WTFEKAIHQNVLIFERSINFGYTYNTVGSQTSNLRGGFRYSLSDYIMPQAQGSYDFFSNRLLDTQGSLVFQSPSRCWSFEIGAQRKICPIQREGDSGICYNVIFDFALN